MREAVARCSLPQQISNTMKNNYKVWQEMTLLSW